MAKMRTIQPPHPSEKFTLEEARRAWRFVEEEHARRDAARRERAAARRRSRPESRADADVGPGPDQPG